MSYQITLEIAEESEEARLIESVAAREQLSREEAALKLIKNSRNGTSEPHAEQGAEQTAEEKRLAAIERFTGCLKDDGQMANAWWHHFDEEHYADIERENQRDLI